jgi:hypothetical protein
MARTKARLLPEYYFTIDVARKTGYNVDMDTHHTTASEYLASLTDPREVVAAADRWWTWTAWDAETEHDAAFELEYSRVLLAGVQAEIALGSVEFTEEDLRNYQAAAEEAA